MCVSLSAYAAFLYWLSISLCEGSQWDKKKYCSLLDIWNSDALELTISRLPLEEKWPTKICVVYELDGRWHGCEAVELQDRWRRTRASLAKLIAKLNPGCSWSARSIAKLTRNSGSKLSHTDSIHNVCSQCTRLSAHAQRDASWFCRVRPTTHFLFRAAPNARAYHELRCSDWNALVQQVYRCRVVCLSSRYAALAYSGLLFGSSALVSLLVS